jgi:hypothetical protein
VVDPEDMVTAPLLDACRPLTEEAMETWPDVVPVPETSNSSPPVLELDVPEDTAIVPPRVAAERTEKSMLPAIPPGALAVLMFTDPELSSAEIPVLSDTAPL